MRFNHWDLGHREGGDVVVVNLPGNEANVRLLDSANFQSYKAGLRHQYYGGQITPSPSEIPIPRNGVWHVLADIQGLGGQSRIDIQVAPRAARQPLPRYQPPSLAPIAQAVANIPPASLPTAHPTPTKNYNVFISHVAEDKDEVVRALAVALEQLELSVRYDEFALRSGDSLRRKIDDGIAHSKFGVVVISEPFFAKEWPKHELDNIVTMRPTGEQVILPVWHRVTKDYIIAQSPSLTDAIARNTTESTIEEIAAEIAEVVYDQSNALPSAEV